MSSSPDFLGGHLGRHPGGELQTAGALSCGCCAVGVPWYSEDVICNVALTTQGYPPPSAPILQPPGGGRWVAFAPQAAFLHVLLIPDQNTARAQWLVAGSVVDLGPFRSLGVAVLNAGGVPNDVVDASTWVDTGIQHSAQGRTRLMVWRDRPPCGVAPAVLTYAAQMATGTMTAVFLNNSYTVPATGFRMARVVCKHQPAGGTEFAWSVQTARVPAQTNLPVWRDHWRFWSGLIADDGVHTNESLWVDLDGADWLRIRVRHNGAAPAFQVNFHVQLFAVEVPQRDRGHGWAKRSVGLTLAAGEEHIMVVPLPLFAGGPVNVVLAQLANGGANAATLNLYSEQIAEAQSATRFGPAVVPIVAAAAGHQSGAVNPGVTLAALDCVRVRGVSALGATPVDVDVRCGPIS